MLIVLSLDLMGIFSLFCDRSNVICDSLFGKTLWEAVLAKSDGDIDVFKNNDYFVVNFPYGVVIIEDKDITRESDFNRCGTLFTFDTCSLLHHVDVSLRWYGV